MRFLEKPDTYLIYMDSNNAVFIVKIYGINIGLFISCQRIAVLASWIKR